MIDKYKGKVTILGLGYIGLPTAALLANSGYLTNGCDVNSNAVDIINSGKIHIVEDGLEDWVHSSVTSGMLTASILPEPADTYIICVPTPFKLSENGVKEPDLSYIKNAVESIAPLIKSGDLIILESTSPVGTTEYVLDLINSSVGIIEDIYVAYCPERVLPGKIIHEIVANDRIVGGIDSISTTKAANFYRNFISGNVIETSSKVAELCKLSENSFRDVNIAYANELSMVCEAVGVDVWELISLANKHPRVSILNPGVGVGGHCIAVDPWFIVSSAPESSKLIQTARNINDEKPKWVINQIKSRISQLSTQPRIACLGISFKPDIDDLRESPALYVVDQLLHLGFNVDVVEPNIDESNSYNLIDLDTAINEADIIVLLVGHKEFLTHEIRQRLKENNVLDFCGVLRQNI